MSPSSGSVQLVDERLRVERRVAEPGRNLLAGGLRALEEEPAQELAGLGAPPPVLADLAHEVRAELRRADPGAQVVGRVEARVHVREEPVRAVAHPGRGAQELRIAVRRPAVLGEPRPEVELVAQLGDVAVEEERLEEDRRLRVLGRLLVGEAEVLRMPVRLAGDRLEDVRVDLGQRVVAGQAAERVRQRRVAAGVVERVPRLVEEGLVVVQPTLRPRDQVHDLRRVGGDHAGARRLLRPVVEVEADVRVVGHPEAEPLQGLEADLDRALLRVGRVEWRHAAQERAVVRRRMLVALGAEEPVEPPLPQGDELRARLLGRVDERALELAERDPLLLLAPRDRVGLAGELGLELLGRAQELEPRVVEGRGGVGVQLAELVPVGVAGEDREARLGRAKRQLLAPEGDARGEDRVLERVVALGELRHEHAGLAGLAKPVEPLALLALGVVLRRAERLELSTAKEVGVARDDRRLLRDLLLAHAHGPPLLGALEEVALELGLVLGRASDGGRAQLTRELIRIYTRAPATSLPTVPISCSSRKGFGMTASASAVVAAPTSEEPEKSAMPADGHPERISRTSSRPSSAPTCTSRRTASTSLSRRWRRASSRVSASSTR